MGVRFCIFRKHKYAVGRYDNIFSTCSKEIRNRANRCSRQELFSCRMAAIGVGPFFNAKYGRAACVVVCRRSDRHEVYSIFWSFLKMHRYEMRNLSIFLY